MMMVQSRDKLIAPRRQIGKHTESKHTHMCICIYSAASTHPYYESVLQIWKKNNRHAVMVMLKEIVHCNGRVINFRLPRIFFFIVYGMTVIRGNERGKIYVYHTKICSLNIVRSYTIVK